jgi:hypothetical protein
MQENFTTKFEFLPVRCEFVSGRLSVGGAALGWSMVEGSDRGEFEDSRLELRTEVSPVPAAS